MSLCQQRLFSNIFKRSFAEALSFSSFPHHVQISQKLSAGFGALVGAMWADSASYSLSKPTIPCHRSLPLA